jgi:predicted deacylase
VTNDSIEIAGTVIEPRQRRRLEIPVARLPTETWMSLPVEVIYGRPNGVRLWLSAAVHGDEISGVEIIRRVLSSIDEKKMLGCLVAVPIVNIYGFINQSRYLPDRRDLNRCFPGSAKGSLASRLANLFMTQIVECCTHGIDLHTGSNHRTNLPQVRADLDDPSTRTLAESFGAPVLMNAQLISGTLRQAALKRGKRVVLYEAGEPMRFDTSAIELGVKGILRVMAQLGMRSAAKRHVRSAMFEVEKSSWLRARRSGIVRLAVKLGDPVSSKQAIGHISDAFGDEEVPVTAPFDGMVIGHTNNPLVHQGDAIVHLGRGMRAPNPNF